MPEHPHKLILSRTEAQEQVHEHFAPQANLLRELANYGTNLVVRAYHSSDHELGDAIACGVLLRQVVSMADATEILASAGAIHAAHLPLRAGFEASVYLEWMLIRDLEQRARYYYVSNLRRERMWAQRGIHGTQEHDSFLPVLQQLGEDIHMLRPSLRTESRTHLADVERLLKKPELEAIDKDFDARKKKSRKEPQWHAPLGPATFRQVAREVCRLPEYEFLYSKGSEVTHTASYKDHLRFTGSTIKFKAIRGLEGADHLLNFAFITAFRSYRSVLAFYRPNELKAFAKLYLEEWREPFVSTKQVVCKL